MERRDFLKTSIVSGAYAITGPSLFFNHSTKPPRNTWYDRPMRWAQLVLVENDPGNFDPDFWLNYFKEVHADAACLSAGGIVAYYPTDIPLHHRSTWLGDSDPFGYLVKGCRDMNMSVIARTDPHAAWQNVYEEHPDWLQVLQNGKKRPHWSNPKLWVTCALGPYNFDFMNDVHREIMERYEIDGIFSNRWAGHGVCYCEHCQRNFKEYSGLDLPQNHDKLDPVFQKWKAWEIIRLKELWLLWDETIRNQKSTSRFIPNGFPDKIVTGAQSDIFFTDHQARRGFIPPWSNGKRAKELRATMGMKPLGGIFSVGIEEEYRWKDSVQNEAEVRVWVAEGTANNMRPWFAKFSGVLYDKRWLEIVKRIYQWHFKNEEYLRNTASLANVAMVYSEQTERNYGGENWQIDLDDHSDGMYHALVESRIPFDMIHDELLEADQLRSYNLLILPNIAALSDKQCEQIKAYVNAGGNILATFETSLYNENGDPRSNFGLTDVFGVTFDQTVEGPMKNSYLKFNPDADGRYHPVLKGLENAFRMINGVYRVNVKPDADFPSPITLIPTYPDLPMEHVYPLQPDTDTRELYLRTYGKGRVAYIPWDADRSFWKFLTVDHLKLLRNTFEWCLENNPPMVQVEGPGIIDITVWEQESSITIHLVNFTNPMMLKGPIRELIPVGSQKIRVRLRNRKKPGEVKLLVSDQIIPVNLEGDWISFEVPSILDHEVVAISG